MKIHHFWYKSIIFNAKSIISSEPGNRVEVKLSYELNWNGHFVVYCFLLTKRPFQSEPSINHIMTAISIEIRTSYRPWTARPCRRSLPAPRPERSTNRFSTSHYRKSQTAPKRNGSRETVSSSFLRAPCWPASSSTPAACRVHHF